MKRFLSLTTTCFLNLLFLSIVSAQTGSHGLGSQGQRPLKSEDKMDLSRDDFQEMMISGRLHSDEISEDNAPGNRVSACASAFNMNTPYNSNNGQRGCMFDVFASNGVTIRCFEASLYAGTTANYEIYYRAGTHVGNESNSAAWTFLGGATSLTSLGTNIPTPIPITINVSIPAGQTYAFYITNDFGGGTSYTDGTSVGNFLASDANLTVYEGVGKSYPFGLTFNVRNFNGHIYYDLTGPMDADEALLTAETKKNEIRLNWTMGEGKQFSDLHIERSSDGLSFETIANPGAADREGGFSDTSIPVAGHYFYRLRLINAEGKIQYSNIAEALLENVGYFEIGSVYPNPFSKSFTLQAWAASHEKIALQLHDQLGQRVFSQTITLIPGQSSHEIIPAMLPSGIYFLHASAGGISETIKIVKQ